MAVEKINSCLEMKGKGKNYILQDEISTMDLGNIYQLIHPLMFVNNGTLHSTGNSMLHV